MQTSITSRTVDHWTADIAAQLSNTEPGWTAEPGSPNEPRSVAYLIGPADDERIRITLLHETNGTPTGTLKIEADLADLEDYAPPGTYSSLRETQSTDVPDEIMMALRTDIIPAMREALPACRDKRNAIAAAEDKRAEILREITKRLPLNIRHPKPRATCAHFGHHGGQIVGRIAVYPDDEVAVDLIASYPEALELAEYLAERRKLNGDAAEPDTYDDEAPF
ncbi:hypothetical protein [Nocardia sp. CA-120079]|uniref:hypothetical protein n=1 Tax=Nocardia sp. CA-120079 TaxID=3239974 RepID=UPI003D97A30D